jgi:DNA-binding beta-propeller fold protein YncE
MAAPLNPRDIVVGVAGADIGLIAIDPNTGDPTRISGWFDDGTSQPTEIGVGPEFSLAYGVHRTSDNQIVVVTGMLGGAIDGTTRIVKVDPATGNRSLLLDSDQFNRPLWGAGPAIQDPYGSALESDNKLLVTDSRGRILRVDLTTGDRTIVSDETHGQGPALNTGMSATARRNRCCVLIRSPAIAAWCLGPVTAPDHS